MRILTLKQLIEADACETQVNLFKKHFNKSVVVTEELAASLKENFNFDWAARNLLMSADARAEYGKVNAISRAEYHKVCAAAWAKYLKVCNPYRNKYDKVCATTFARLYIADKGK